MPFGDLDHLVRRPGGRVAPLDDVGRGREHVAGQVLGAGVARDQVGERGLLELGEEVQAGGAGEVVEPVAVLQRLHLGLEDEVEGRAQQAAERHLLLGEAADPEVDIVEAGDGRRRPACSPRRLSLFMKSMRRPAHRAHDDGERRGALVGERGRVEDRLVRAVGGDEVDQRLGVLDRQPEVDPALVGLELAVAAGAVEELAPGRVQGRDAGVAAARQVDGGEVERQAEQVVAQRVGDELVDLVADLAGHAAHDLAGGRRRSASPRSA